MAPGARGQPELGDVGDPQLVGPPRAEPVGAVREQRQVGRGRRAFPHVAAPGSAAPAAEGEQALLAHDPAHDLIRGADAPAPGLGPDRPVAPPPAGLEGLANQRPQGRVLVTVLIFTENWSSWSRFSEHRGHEKMSSLIKWAASRGQGRGPRHTVSRAATLASPPGKDGGDDRAPGRKE